MDTASDARFWDRSAPKYARSPIADVGGYERTLQRTRQVLPPGGNVLELGCGTGTTALRLSDAAASYHATDISQGMIAQARTRLAENPVPGLTFRAATAETVASDGQTFDAVLGFNYLHLVRDVPATLRTVHALLAPGGLFVSKTACLGDMNPLIRLILLPAMRAVGKAPHVSVFTGKQLESMIAEAGFEIVAREDHATKGRDTRPFIVARKR